MEKIAKGEDCGHANEPQLQRVPQNGEQIPFAKKQRAENGKKDHDGSKHKGRASDLRGTGREGVWFRSGADANSHCKARPANRQPTLENKGWL